jgi:predicted exporter
MRRYLSVAVARLRWPTVLWLLSVLACALVVGHSHFVADMSAFLPRNPTAQQQILVDEVTRGSLSRTLLIGIEGGTASQRAALSHALAQSMRGSGDFALVSNGENSDEKSEAELFLRYRYLMSPRVDPERFTVEGLHRAIAAGIDGLTGSLGGSMKDLFPRDPTGELLELLSDLGSVNRPRTVDGVWMARDGERAMLIAMTRADGADTDAQERLIRRIRDAFDQAAKANQAIGARLLISGSALFAVDARAVIKSEVTRLSMIGAFGMMSLLLLAFRSIRALGMCLMPVLTGALAGTAAVSLWFGTVHGITIGFGSTLIGEAVDYSIYYFIQSQPRRTHDGDDGRLTANRWLSDFWPTIRLGMLTSICGFSALVFSDFPGLAQLGVYSIAGLVAAALVTRFVLPQFPLSARPLRFDDRLTGVFERVAAFLQRMPTFVLTASVLALAFLAARHSMIWNPALSGLSPVSLRSQQLDESLRADLGAPQMRFLLVVEATGEEQALRGAEAVSDQLRALQSRKIIDGFESPSKLVPSLASQRLRQAALPDPGVLAQRLPKALDGLPLRPERLTPFVHDVAAARQLPPLTREGLGQTDLALSFDALMLRGTNGVTAFLPVRQAAPRNDEALDAGEARAASVGATLQQASRAAQQSLRAQGVQQTRVSFIDMAQESVQIYAKYFNEILALSGFGVLAIAILLGYSLRDPRRTAAVLLPLALAVLLVMAGLVALGEKLTLLHLVGMLLIVAVGSNYALFFNRSSVNGEGATGFPAPTTLLSLLLANASTSICFGVLAFSTVPVLHALGVTVAPGAILALLLSIVFAPNRRHGHAAAR